MTTTRGSITPSEASFKAWLGALMIFFALIGLGVRWSYGVATTSQDQVLSALVKRHGDAAALFMTKWRADHLWPSEEDLVDLRDLARAYDADPARLATVEHSAADVRVLWAKDTSRDMFAFLIGWPLVALSSLIACVLGGVLIQQSGVFRRSAPPAQG